MAFDAREVQFLQRLIADRPDRRRGGSVATHLCENYGIGTAAAGEILYSYAHHRMAEQLLRSNDLPVQALGPSASRAQAAEYGGMSEKSGTTNPHAGSIALRCFGRCLLDGQPIQTPGGTYLVATRDVARRIECESIVFVENLETFRQLELYRWIEHREAAVMAVFRGDTTFHVGEALALVRERSEPLRAFVDFDPAGLLIAQGLSDRLSGLVLPDLAKLKPLADTLRGRELYDQQLQQAQATLNACRHPAIEDAWLLLQLWRCGVTQERMLAL